MFCPKCGSSNQDNARYCNTCGAELPNLEGEGRDTRWNAPARRDERDSGARMAGGPQAPVKTHLIPAILIAIFCCQPLGIIAIVFSALAMGKNSDEEYAQAKRYADISYKCSLAGILLWLFVVVIWVILIAMGISPLADQPGFNPGPLPPGFPAP